MKILFADDHPLLLDGLKNAVQQKYPNAELYTALNKLELFNQLKLQKIDLLFQDIKYGSNHAKDFLADIRSEFPDLKILILTSISEVSTIQYFSKHSDAYVIKSESLDIIFLAVESILKNEKYLSPASKIKLAKTSSSDEIILTKREREILALIIQAQSIKEIATSLSISEKTVEMHRGNLFIKLNVKNVAGLVQKALALNILED